MRVNVYDEELTDEVECLKQSAKTGAKYYGLRFYLRSPKELHTKRKDDDRSAVTLWTNDRKRLVMLLAKAIDEVSK